MSGPVSTSDTGSDGPALAPEPPTVEVTPSRVAKVGEGEVRRALPRHPRRAVGAWCFADHFGPAQVVGGPHGEPLGSVDIGPHPHIGLQTVTWLVEGELLHRDSLGSEQLIQPGQLNLMTAGHGVVHAEETPSTYRGGVHGAQLWVALPEETRHGPAAFEHHVELPQAGFGSLVATVFVGALGDARSPARADTRLVGAELLLDAGQASVPLDPESEHCVVVLEGELGIDGTPVAPSSLAYLGIGREQLAVVATTRTRALLLGGEPFPTPISMWWNFVARTHDEIDAAARDWQAEAERFGAVDSRLARIPAPRPPWWPADRTPEERP